MANDEKVVIKSLATGDGLTWLLENALSNFILFPALAMVIVTMFGIGIAEKAGLLNILIISSIAKSPRLLATPIVLFVGLIGNLAGSSAFVVIPPLGALVYRSLNRHPLAGIASAFAGLAAGLSANLLITPTDVVNAGITQSATRLVDEAITVDASANWYFMAASTLILTLAGWFVIDRIVEPRLWKVMPFQVDVNEDTDGGRNGLSILQKKGLVVAGLSFSAFTLVILLLLLPQGAPLRAADGAILGSPFMAGLIPILTVAFFIPGLSYGVTVGTVKSSRDLIRMLAESIAELSDFILVCFFAGQLIAIFAYTNIGVVASSVGAEKLSKSGFTGAPLVLSFIALSALLNFFIGILSAKWALLSPIFVPLFMKLGYSPHFVQAAFRIADSVTNPISPLEVFMPYMITCAQKYCPRAGLGTIIAMMLPITISFTIVWTALLLVWVAFDWLLGPGASVYL